MVAEYLNEEKRKHERRSRMLQLSQSISHADAFNQIIKPGRELLEEGPVIYHNTKKRASQMGTLFLFTDMVF